MNEITIDNKCPNCAAVLKWNPKLSKWKCDYCDSEFSIEELKKYDNASNDENNKETEQKSQNNEDSDQDSANYVSYTCPDCGAEIVADEQTVATFCVYCGNTAILKNKLSGEFRPSKIIPFKKVKEDATIAFKNLSKGRPLMPKEFNNTKNIEKIRGIYIPFWLYDINVSGNISAKGDRVSHWSSGDTRYTKTDTYLIERDGTLDLDLVPADGSTRFDNDIMNTIEPFDYKDLIDYNHAYLSGFLAEKYDITSDKEFETVAKRSVNSSTDIFKSSMTGYDSMVITSNSLEAKAKNVMYTLLPVWMVNVKYEDKYYLFAMNGQTGEFIGNIPTDKKKMILYSVLIFIVTFLIVILVSYIIFKVGK